MRKILTIAVLLLSGLAEHGYAQKADSATKSYVFRDERSITTTNPLCIIDGKPLPDSLYKKLFKIINSKDVLKINVLKGAAGAALYGAAGANGVIIITMKTNTYNAQNAVLPERDTIYTNSARRLVFKNGIKRAYIKINDSVYNGRLQSIDTGNISSIDIFKPEDAVEVFGAKAANGAILIKTKLSNAAPPIANKIMPVLPLAPKQTEPLVLVDGKVYTGDINKIDPQDIIEINVLQKGANSDPKESDTQNGETLITTKKQAIALYQEKFSAISKKYKAYIDLKHNDSNLQYVLNNDLLNIQRKSAITDLYQLPASNIESIEFKKDSHFTTDATVIITTKE